MAIAAGFYTKDGLVLCADAQRTTSRYIRTDEGKVELSVFDDRRVLAIAGAGNWDYIQIAREALVEEFGSRKTWPEVKAGLKRTCLKFFDEHLAQWSHYPEHDRPENELIHRYCFGQYTAAQLTNLAVYIFSKVKEGMEGCLGSTHIVGLRQGGDLALTDHRVVDQWEKELLEIEDKISLQFVKSLTEKPIDLGWMSECVKKTGR